MCAVDCPNTLRDPGRLGHPNVGWSYRGHAIRLDGLDDVTFTTHAGELIRTTRLDPERDYPPHGHGCR